LVRWLIEPGAGFVVPFATFFPAILLSSLIGGWRLGVFALIASFLCAQFFFITPTFGIDFTRAGSRINAALFLGKASPLIWMGAYERTLMRDRRDHASDLTTLLEEQSHRIKNKLALVQAILTMQANASGEPAVKEALNRATLRVKSIADVHEHLRRGER